MGILTACSKVLKINRAGTSGTGHLRVMRTTGASLEREASRGIQETGRGFGVGTKAGTVPVTTLSDAASSTGGR